MSKWLASFFVTMMPAHAVLAANKPLIAVIDTGGSIPDIYPNAEITYFDARSLDSPIVTSGPQYQSKHGTWVTSAILEKVSGPVRILSYRTDKQCEITNRCTMDTRALVRAARHAYGQGATIIQISSYGQLDRPAEDALVGMSRSGVDIVMCAGNEGGVTKLAPLALRSPKIHIVGSLSGPSRRSDFSAHGPSGNDDLLRWRPGEQVIARNPDGRLTRVTGTSFAASLMTADLVMGKLQQAQAGAAPAAPVMAVAMPKPIAAPNNASSVATALPARSRTMEPLASVARVDLAAAGEISVERLTAPERARLLSRAIRPESDDRGITSLSSEVGAAREISPPETSATGGRSRAVRPKP